MLGLAASRICLRPCVLTRRACGGAVQPTSGRHPDRPPLRPGSGCGHPHLGVRFRSCRAASGAAATHGICTSPTRIAVVRSRTKNGSNPRASCADDASTAHQIACPPEMHDESVTCRRSGLSPPLNDANATPHSPCSWTWWSRYLGTLAPLPFEALATSGEHPDLPTASVFSRPASVRSSGPVSESRRRRPRQHRGSRRGCCRVSVTSSPAVVIVNVRGADLAPPPERRVGALRRWRRPERQLVTDHQRRAVAVQPVRVGREDGCPSQRSSDCVREAQKLVKC